MRLVTVAEMVAVEQEADASGLSYAQMMENAGHGLAEIIQDLAAEATDREILALVGPGNNGGDTLVALSLLVADGWHARAYLVKRATDSLVERLKKAGGQVHFANEDEGLASLAVFIGTATVLVDGVLGTGSAASIENGRRPGLGRGRANS